VFWEKLSAGEEKGRCGGLKDKFGLSWQVVPSVMGEMMQDREKSSRVMAEVLRMNKLDIAALQRASQGNPS
jgi:predicted 3-demethylubiquinone-9 3-methyltransferase (glyoxalase superfamily)